MILIHLVEANAARKYSKRKYSNSKYSNRKFSIQDALGYMAGSFMLFASRYLACMKLSIPKSAPPLRA